MAKYEYECELDGIFDFEYPIGQQPETEDCPVCEDLIKRKFSTFGVSFKGTGWGGSK